MTRKDYILIAETLKDTRSNVTAERGTVKYECQMWSESQHKQDCEALADALIIDNPRFDRARFLTACGVQS